MHKHRDRELEKQIDREEGRMDEQRRILGLGTRRISWGRVVGGRVRCNLGSQRK